MKKIEENRECVIATAPKEEKEKKKKKSGGIKIYQPNLSPAKLKNLEENRKCMIATAPKEEEKKKQKNRWNRNLPAESKPGKIKIRR